MVLLKIIVALWWGGGRAGAFLVAAWGGLQQEGPGHSMGQGFAALLVFKYLHGVSFHVFFAELPRAALHH